MDDEQQPASRTTAAGRSGGPRTAEGKSAASKNALKSGVASLVWIVATEQDRYDDLVAQLKAEYSADSATLLLLIEHLAMVVVKIERLQGIENAHFEKARITTAHFARQRPPNSLATYLPDTREGQEEALRIATGASMPDLERLNVLARYQNSLDRQRSKLIGEIRAVFEAAQRQVEVVQDDRASLALSAGSPAAASDATVVQFAER